MWTKRRIKYLNFYEADLVMQDVLLVIHTIMSTSDVHDDNYDHDEWRINPCPTLYMASRNYYGHTSTHQWLQDESSTGTNYTHTLSQEAHTWRLCRCLYTGDREVVSFTAQHSHNAIP